MIRRLHLWLGLAAGLVVFTVAITGCLYAFEEEIRNSIYSEYLEVKDPGTERLSIDSLAAVVKAGNPKQGIKNIRIRTEPAASIEVVLKNKRSVFIDPYTAKIIGKADKDNDLMGTVLKIHRNLYLGNPGKIITGTSASIFVVMLITGIILWWPKKGKSKKASFSLMRNAGWPRRIYDLHNVLGFYASWIIIFTALTGITISFKWAEGAVFSMLGSTKSEERVKSKSKENENVLSFESIAARSLQLCPTTNYYVLYLPEGDKDALKVQLNYRKEGFLKKHDQLFFDRYSGELITEKYFKDLSAGEKWKANNVNIHTGASLGFAGRLAVFFAALIAASLPVTGFLVWRNRVKKAKA